MLRSEQVTIDCLQYCNWSPAIFDQMAQGGVDAAGDLQRPHGELKEVRGPIRGHSFDNN